MPSLSGRHDGKRILARVAIFGSERPADLTFVSATALIDTGATASAIAPRIIDALGLMPFAKRPLMVATEERLVEFHIFRIGFVPDSAAPNSLPFVFADIEGFAMRASHGFEVILGMNVLSQCDLIINRDHAWSVTFG